MVEVLGPLLGARAPAVSRRLLKAFGSIGGVLRASSAAVTRAAGVTDAAGVAPFLRAIHALNVQALRQEVADGPVMSSSSAAATYLRASMAGLQVEHVRALYLNVHNRLIGEVTLSIGSVDVAYFHVRDIFRHALEFGATGVILAHNHPSGDPAPSDRDVAVTRHAIQLGRMLGIDVHDHIVVATGGSASLMALGLMNDPPKRGRQRPDPLQRVADPNGAGARSAEARAARPRAVRPRTARPLSSAS